MTDNLIEKLHLGDGRRLAYRHCPGVEPSILFCGGLKSDMTGIKAVALECHVVQSGHAFTRFDYGGHGASDGDFKDGTIGSWAKDALAILDHVTKGAVIVVGSSMGGWIMILLALARPDRIIGLIGIAAAPDFTERLIWAMASADDRKRLQREGVWHRSSAYDDNGTYPITRRLIEEGRDHLVLDAPIAIDVPVHLLHGQRDVDVPWPTSLRLAEQLCSMDVTLELVKSGDHRLSKPGDLIRLMAAVDRILAGEAR